MDKTQGRLDRMQADLKEQSTGLRTRFEAEQGAIQKVRDIRQQIEQVGIQIEQAERAADLQRAAELCYGRLHQLEQDLLLAQSELDRLQEDGAMLKEEVDSQDIAPSSAVGPASRSASCWRARSKS